MQFFLVIVSIFALPFSSIFSSAIVAHRGGYAAATENTLEAFSKSIASKVDYIEFDVQFTKDFVPIVVHDTTTERLWKGKSRTFSSMTLEEVKQLQPKKAPFFTIPTLEEALALTLGKVGLMIDIKGDGTKDYPKIVDVTLKVLQKYPVPTVHKYYLNSSEPAILEQIIKKAPEQKTCLTIQDPACFSYIEELSPTIVSIHFSFLSKELVRKMQKSGLEVWTWSVGREERFQECLDIGVDAVMTGQPEKMQKHLLLARKHNVKYR